MLAIRRALGDIPTTKMTGTLRKLNVPQGLAVVLVLLAFGIVFTTRSDSAPSARDEHLIVVENAPNEAYVYVISKNSPVNKRYSLGDGSQLSPACADRYSRCEKLFVESLATAHQYIITIPLMKQLAILDLRYNGAELLLHKMYTLELSCSPEGTYKILTFYYVSCVAQHQVSFYRMDLNTSSIENSMVRSLPAVSISFTPDSSQLSNFVYVADSVSHMHLIYFSVADLLFAAVLLENRYFFVDFLGTNCPTADSLAYARSQSLFFHCQNGSVIFDLQNDHHDYQDQEFPYVCPDPDVYLAVRVSPNTQGVHYGIPDQNSFQDFTLPGMDFDSGVCFSSMNRTLFAFIDRQKGTYILDTTAAESDPIRLSSQECAVSECRSPVVYDNRYVVIRELGGENGPLCIKVLDLQANREAIIDRVLLSGGADFIALIYDLEPIQQPIPSPAVNSPAPDAGEQGLDTATIAGISVGAVVVATLALIGIIAAAIACTCSRNSSIPGRRLEPEGTANFKSLNASETQFSNESDSSSKELEQTTEHMQCTDKDDVTLTLANTSPGAVLQMVPISNTNPQNVTLPTDSIFNPQPSAVQPDSAGSTSEFEAVQHEVDQKTPKLHASDPGRTSETGQQQSGASNVGAAANHSQPLPFLQPYISAANPINERYSDSSIDCVSRSEATSARPRPVETDDSVPETLSPPWISGHESQLSPRK